MDPIEKASILLGKKSNGYVGKASTSLNSTNVTMISGVAMSDSADGSVTVNLDGYTISDKDEQAVEIPTTVSVKAGDTVQISLIGADGTAKSMIVTGVIAGGDRMQADIEGAKDTAASADTAATIAKENAAKANELANEAISNANAANTQAQEAMNDVNTANGKIATLQKNVDTMNSDISTAQTAISKNASDISGINQKLSTDYATKGEISDVKVSVESEIDTKANAITASVAETYAAKSDVTKITDSLSNRISVNEKGISTSSDEIKTLKSDTESISKNVTAAQDAASAAQKTADTAVSNANAAQTAADNAKKAADTAQSTANGASTAAANAQSAADSANTAASNAQTAANSAKTAADNAKSAADKANSDLAKLTDTVTTQGTKIDQNSGSISSIASRTTTVENKFTNYYTKEETNSQIKQTADGINSTVSKKVGKDEVISSINQSAEEVKINANRVTINGTLSVTDAINNAQTAANNAQSAVDNIQVGGRNLYIGTKDFSGDKFKNLNYWVNDGFYNGFTVKKRTGAWRGIYQEVTAQVGDVYTFSFYAKADGGKVLTFVPLTSNPPVGFKTISSNLNVTNSWARYSVTIEITSIGNTVKFRIENNSNTATTWICGLKLERGNRATDWTPAPEDVQSGIDAAQSTANSASSTANTTKTYFYNDSTGSHVVSQNSTSAGSRTDIKADGMHVIDQDDGKELASFTSSGAAIGKDSEMHSRYSSDGVRFYEGGKSYPFTQIKPVTYENEKYSAAVFTTSPDDISTDDGLYHSGATLALTAINGTSNSNVGVGEAVLTATTVQSADPKSAYIDVFASNDNPNKSSGGKTVEDTYINMVAEEVYVNNSPISHIGEIYRQEITYTTKKWAQGTWTATLQLPVGVYVVVSFFDLSSFQKYIYRQLQILPRSGNVNIYPNWLGLYQEGNNTSADVASSTTHIVEVTSANSSIGPYIHTDCDNLKVPIKMAAVRIR